MSLSACEEGFEPYYSISKVRILGVCADKPEICPLGPDLCPPQTYSDEVHIAILAADDTGIVADGLYPDGPYVKEGYTINWSLCQYAFRIGEVPEPDCTREVANQLDRHSPLLTVSAQEIWQAFLMVFGELPADMSIPTGDSMDPQELITKFGQEYVEQVVGMSIESPFTKDAIDENQSARHWGIKRIRLSMQNKADININPALVLVSIAGKQVIPGERPSLEVQTGYSYPISWVFDPATLQEYAVETADSVVKKKELFHLSFFATGGSFNQNDPVEIWRQDVNENKLFWRAPLEVPPEGQIITLIFKLWDARGGCDWTWTTVRVVRGPGILPR